MDLNLLKLSVITLLNFLAIGYTIPVIAPRLLEIGASHAVLGISTAIQTGLLVLTGPVVGAWSDIRGRKFVVTVTLVISAACYLVQGFTTSVVVVCILRTILGITDHAPILSRAIIGDLIPKENHSKAYSITGVMASLGFIVGPIIGGHLVEVENGFFYVSALAAINYLLITGITQTFPEKPKAESKKPEDTNLKKQFLKIFVELSKVDWKKFGDLLFLRFVLSLSVVIYFINQSIYIRKKYQLPQKSIGYIMALFGALGIAATILVPYIKTNFYKNDSNSSKLLLHQYFILTVSFLMLYIVSSLYIHILVLVPLALSNAILTMVTMEVILGKSTDSDRGSLTGVSESVTGIGRFFAPLASGIIATYIGESSVLLFASLSSLTGVIVCFKLYQEKDVTKEE